SSSTGCVEVWADNITISNTAEINADIQSTSSGGGPGGTSWIDLFANTNISITGKTGATDPFAVHADSYVGSDQSPNTVTAKAINGTFTGSGKILSAKDMANGSAGGTVTVQADNDVNMDASAVLAAGDLDGAPINNGGDIFVRSFNGAVNWRNGDGDVRPSTGTINRSDCQTADPRDTTLH